MNLKKKRYAALGELTAKPSDYKDDRCEQLSFDDVIVHEPDQCEISSLMDEFYVQANSLNAEIHYMRELAARSRCLFNMEMCKRLEQLESMIRSLAAVVEEIRR